MTGSAPQRETIRSLLNLGHGAADEWNCHSIYREGFCPSRSVRFSLPMYSHLLSLRLGDGLTTQCLQGPSLQITMIGTIYKKTHVMASTRRHRPSKGRVWYGLIFGISSCPSLAPPATCHSNSRPPHANPLTPFLELDVLKLVCD